MADLTHQKRFSSAELSAAQLVRSTNWFKQNLFLSENSSPQFISIKSIQSSIVVLEEPELYKSL